MAPTIQPWPPCLQPLPPDEYAELARRIRPALLARMAAERIPPEQEDALTRVYLPLAAWTKARKAPGEMLALGVNGAQGSGKSTLCEFLQLILREAFGLRAVGLSIDDLYKTRAERQAMARNIHPLFATRGVPGTHDVELGLSVLAKLRAGASTRLPAFDKAMDERREASAWPLWQGPADVAVFEGWCVGARAQTAEALREPINELERVEDTEGVWRGYANQQLQGPYAELFSRLDRLIMLKVPDFADVYRWRALQERKLAEAGGGNQVMDETALRRFIMHYERLTRHCLGEMPGRVDLTLHLGQDHRVARIDAGER